MNEYTKYWVWFQQSVGYATAKVNTVRNFYGSIKEFYQSGLKEWTLCGCFGKRELNRMETFSLQDAQNIIDKCTKLDYKIIAIDEAEYPQRLSEIFNPPAVLYISGNLPPIDHCLCIGMVGTRQMTPSGKRSAFNFAANLANAGAVIVSGGALGIDSASHLGALQSGGVTVCVLGCGINSNYLMKNAQMRGQISACGGAVISEYAPDSRATKFTFPQRNRIISGLSQGVLVVEAGEKSGALITADFALEQNRDVFAIPGDITNATSFGTNNLIKQGAKPVTSYTEILDEYSGDFAAALPQKVFNDADIPPIPVSPPHNGTVCHKVSSVNVAQKADTVSQKPKKANTDSLSENARAIYEIIYSMPSSTDDIISKTGLPVNKVMQALTELELFTIAERRTGRKYYPI